MNIELVLRMLGVITRDPQVSARLGYVNPGDDLRIAGEIGRTLGYIQSACSFKSATPPVLGPVEVIGEIGDDTYLQTATAPNGRQHYTVSRRRSDGTWDVVRVGWRYDPAWGDQNSIGVNPDPNIVGGYIFDFSVKLGQSRSHIEGVT